MVFVFFSESQFDSYRMLGVHTMEKLCTDHRGDFRRFIRDILKRHLEMQASGWLARLPIISPTTSASLNCF